MDLQERKILEEALTLAFQSFALVSGVKLNFSFHRGTNLIEIFRTDLVANSCRINISGDSPKQALADIMLKIQERF